MFFQDKRRKDRAKRSLDAATRRLLTATGKDRGVRQAFLRLLPHVHGCADLLHRTPLGG
jgi:hypothetical protein